MTIDERVYMEKEAVRIEMQRKINFLLDDLNKLKEGLFTTRQKLREQVNTLNDQVRNCVCISFLIVHDIYFYAM